MNKHEKRTELWNAFCEVESILKTLKSVVQNDMEYTREMRIEYLTMDSNFLSRYSDVASNTLGFIGDNMEKGD